MRFSQTLIAVALIGVVFSSARAEGLSDTQKQDVETVVRELLLKKEPDLIVKAAQEVQRRVEKEELQKGQASIGKYKKELWEDQTSPVIGNPKGDVTVVEFFDYACGYCKVVQPAVQDLLAEDKNIRFIFKELPILGSASMEAAKASLASAKQGKYAAFHAELMNSKERLSRRTIRSAAEKVGLDAGRLEKDMADPAIAKVLEANTKLAGSVGARGTPTFIIGDKLYAGALPVEQMKEIVAEVRTAAQKK